jgi:hypothetical protein
MARERACVRACSAIVPDTPDRLAFITSGVLKQRVGKCVIQGFLDRFPATYA